MNGYAVHEMFLTLQGEGGNAGRRAVFVRFAGCNLWSGDPAARGASCSAWCDTEFRGTGGANGGRYHAAALAGKAAELWGDDRDRRFVVLTGGEPMLQVDAVLIETLRRFDFTVAVETNGTRKVSRLIDWITVSPKADTEVVQRYGEELKLAYPQAGVAPADFLGDGWVFDRFYLQPIDGPDLAANTKAAADYCLANPAWRLSAQLHKQWGLP